MGGSLDIEETKREKVPIISKVMRVCNTFGFGSLLCFYLTDLERSYRMTVNRC